MPKKCLTPSHTSIARDFLNNGLIDDIRLNGSGQGELNSRRVHNSDNISASGGINNSIEWALLSVLSVDIQNLLVVVRSLQKLNTSVQWTAISLQGNLHRLHSGGEGGGVHSSSLNRSVVTAREEDLRGTGALGHVALESGGERELHLSSVADGDSVGASGAFNGATEWALASVLKVDGHLLGSIVRSLPQVDVGVEGAAGGLEQYVDAVDALVEGACAEGSSLHLDGVDLIENLLGGTGSVVLGHHWAGVVTYGVSDSRGRAGAAHGGGGHSLGVFEEEAGLRTGLKGLQGGVGCLDNECISGVEGTECEGGSGELHLGISRVEG